MDEGLPWQNHLTWTKERRRQTETVRQGRVNNLTSAVDHIRHQTLWGRCRVSRVPGETCVNEWDWFCMSARLLVRFCHLSSGVSAYTRLMPSQRMCFAACVRQRSRDRGAVACPWNQTHCRYCKEFRPVVGTGPSLVVQEKFAVIVQINPRLYFYHCDDSY